MLQSWTVVVAHAPISLGRPRTPVQATRSASQKAAEWSLDTRVLVGVGAVAATCSGMLSALSGVGGPPLILMYELLAVPKVRACLQSTAYMVSYRSRHATEYACHLLAITVRGHLPFAGDNHAHCTVSMQKRLHSINRGMSCRLDLRE